MKAYEVFLVQTQSTINYLYIPVIAILPLLWLGDCKRSMSLLFKRIHLPNLYDISYERIELTNNSLILIIIIAIISYLLHRFWRNHLLDMRSDILKQEIELTDNEKFNNMKIKILQTINNIIERKAKIGIYLENTNTQEVNDVQEIE